MGNKKFSHPRDKWNFFDFFFSFWFNSLGRCHHEHKRWMAMFTFVFQFQQMTLTSDSCVCVYTQNGIALLCYAERCEKVSHVIGNSISW